MEPCAPGVALDDLQCSVPPEHVNALHCFHLDFYIYHFYWQQTPKVSVWGSCIQVSICKQSGKLALLSFQNFRVFVMFLFCSVIYTVSCMPVAKVNHVIPCFSIRWKSKGSLFIKCLTLILSWGLIVTTLRKLNLLSLKVTMTSFQSISSVPHR